MQRRTTVEARLTTAREQETQLEQAMSADAPVLSRAQETWYRLSALTERFRGTAQLADERVKFLQATPEETRPGRDPEALEREAAGIRGQHQELEAALNADRGRLTDAIEQKKLLEQRAVEAEKALVAAVRAVADRREGLARLTGQVNTMRSRSQAAADEIERLSGALADADERVAVARTQFEAAQSESDGLDEGKAGLEARRSAAQEAVELASARVNELTDAWRTAEREGASFAARSDALAMSLDRKDGVGALLALGAEQVPGLVGSVAGLLTVRPQWQAAVAAALGSVADGAAVSSTSDAVSALSLLKAGDAGQAQLLVANRAAAVPRDAWPSLPAGAQWAIDVLQVPAEFASTVEQLLDRVALVSDLPAAHGLVCAHPDVRAVTETGDVLSATWAAGGSAHAPSVIEIQAAHDQAREQQHQVESQAEQAKAQLAVAKEAQVERKQELDMAVAALREQDQQANSRARNLAGLSAAVRSAQAEAERLRVSRDKAHAAREADAGGLADLEERLRLAEDTPAEDEPSTSERDEHQALAAQARQNEMEVRLAVRTGEERARALAGRAESLERAAASERAARERAEKARKARAAGAIVAQAVARAARIALERIDVSLRTAESERDRVQQERVRREGELLELRTGLREMTAELDRLTDAVHRDEVARAEQRMRIEQLEIKAADDFGIDVETLLAEYNPQLPVPPTPAEIAQAEAEGQPTPPPLPYHRPTQEKRAARAERELTLLGKVNPLALEEFAALEERHAFLSTQLEDLKTTRRDLMTVVKEVDDRIHDVFASAYEDTAREFEIVFRTLFPGGEGRLVLTDPENMLTTGIEVEARPPGKKVKRLSLLSGGERSLTAVALLVAIFRARPSPFYVMDEVEAALDDTNLGRLIGLIEELRSSSQLIIISHQKRTMEIADALYGVSMRGDGITQVISQRLREVEV